MFTEKQPYYKRKIAEMAIREMDIDSLISLREHCGEGGNLFGHPKTIEYVTQIVMDRGFDDEYKLANYLNIKFND